MLKKLVFSVALLSLSFAPTLSFASDNSLESEVNEVEKVVANFYESLNNQDSDLYLKSIANSKSEVAKFNATHLEDTAVKYKIVDIGKVNESKYEVDISKVEDDVEYPTIPYDVVLEDGTWKFDPSKVVIYPKDMITVEAKVSESPYRNVVSENENFSVGKITGADEISTNAFRTYNFGSYSTDIYSPGSLLVESMPGRNTEDDDRYNFVIAEIYRVEPNGENVFQEGRDLDGFVDDSVRFSGYNGYHKIWCGNFNYSWLPGKYNVVW
ncbi:hypothetical protein D3C74_59620 [compost metagenome]